MPNAPISELRDAMQQARQVLITSHLRPDGDAIGSLLGLGLALQAAGKDVQMVLADGVPAAFRHLAGSNTIATYALHPYNLTIVVDCADQMRTAGILPPQIQPDINIDHHITNDFFARLNYVQPQAASTAEIIAALLPELGFSIPPGSAEALLTGILTDTQGFRTPNTTPQTLTLAAQLIQLGANLGDLYRQALVQRSFAAARLWGKGLERLQRSGRLVWATLTLEDRKTIGYNGRDDADLINFLVSIKEADVAVIFVEQPDKQVKISWRSQPGFDISQIAVRFGGGGHPNASGATLNGTIESVQQLVLEATQQTLSETPN